nr:reverse transcriptase domain-containing protein [Tanacetum cinerariifolium]
MAVSEHFFHTKPSIGSVLVLPSNWLPLTTDKWLPLIVKSLAVSGIVIAEPGVRATTRQFSGVVVDYFFNRKELFCFVDDVFDSEYVQVQKALGTRLDMSTTYHPQMDGQSKRTIQTIEDMLRACVIDFSGSWDVYLPLAEFSYNNGYHSSIRRASFEALYRKKCRPPVLWAKIRERRLIGPELVQEMTDKVFLIQEKLKTVRDRQKSYTDNRRKPLEFEVGDQVLLKLSP